MAVRENEFSFDALRETFDNQAKTKEEDIAKLNKIISNLNNEIFVLKENLDLKVEREESLTKMLIAVKESLNVLKVECEDVTQKANNDIELLTTEMENIRECVKEKVELEDELKQQISCMRKECEDAISEKKLRENLAEEKISILQNELDESLKERKQNAECFNEKIADLKLKVADLETVNMDLKSRGEIAREIESQKQQLEEQLSNAKDVIQKLEQIRERLFCEKEVLENRNKICETDNITLKQDMDIMDEKLRQTNEDLINLKLNLDGKGKVIEKLNNNIQISSQKYEDLYKEFQTVVTNACDLKLEIEHFKESELGLSTEINKLRQINNEQERFMMENQVLKGQLKTQMEIASKRISDSEEKESEIWRRLIEKNNEVKAKISEIEVLKKDLESIKENSEDKKWKNLYEDLLEKVEPFKNQLDAYAHEKSLLTSETDHALKQLHDLQEKYAKFMGQANHKQKIQYLCKLQHELSKLRMENMKLKEMNYKQNLIIQKCQTEPTASNSTKTKAKKPSLPLKENTPSAFF